MIYAKFNRIKIDDSFIPVILLKLEFYYIFLI